ncbi:MAG TPA: Spy/CpxP family protein refolding chaperone [Chroococcales cyanobacterium]
MKIKLMPMVAGAIALSVVATPLIIKAQAQTPNQTQPAHAHHQRKWDQLNLSDQQKAQLQQIQKDTHTQIEAVYTPEQREQLKTARQNRQAHQAGQAHQGRHSMMAALNLTDAQKAKIKAIKEAQKARMQAILTPEQQQQLQQMHQQWQQQHQQRQQQHQQRQQQQSNQ